MNNLYPEELTFIKVIRSFPNEPIINVNGKLLIGLVWMEDTPRLIDFIWELVHRGIMRTISLTENIFELVCMPRDVDIQKIIAARKIT